MGKVENEIRNASIGNIIDRTITALEAVGLTRKSALHLLVIQSVIRLDIDDEADVAQLRGLKESVDHTLSVIDNDRVVN